MKKHYLTFLFTAFIVSFIAVPAQATSIGGPHLWLSTDPSQFDAGGVGYVEDNSDPWLEDSYVTYDNPFTLFIYHAGPEVKGEAEDIHLMIAVHEGESGSVTVGSTTYNSFPESDLGVTEYGNGNHGVYGPHDGVFAITASLGDLDPFESMSFSITSTGFSAVHFDVFSDNGFYNPASHDATYVPEPSTVLLLGSGLIGLAYFRRRRN